MEHVATPRDGALAADPSVAPCSCDKVDLAPWRKRDALDSPASVVAGVVVIAFGVLAVQAGRVSSVGWILLGVLLGLTVLAAITWYQRGHRGACLVGRSLWTGVAWLGLPLRVAAAVPF